MITRKRLAARTSTGPAGAFAYRYGVAHRASSLRALLTCRAMAPTPDRKSQLITAASAYFEGLARKDFTSVPWAETVVFRSPLTPGGAEAPLIGRNAVLAFFTAL